MLSNAIRGHMAELGIISAKGRNGTAELLATLANEQDDRIPMAARFSLDVLARQYAVLTTEIGVIESAFMPGTDHVKKANGCRRFLASVRSWPRP